MSQPQTHILLVTYSFPPNADVGSRRWAKLAKYLGRKKIIVHVLTVGKQRVEGPVVQDGNPNIWLHYVKENYPVEFYKQPKNIGDKLWRKIVLFFLKIAIKGTPYDRGAFMEKQIIAKSRELIERYAIKNVIATGAPFSFLRYAVKLKSLNNVNVICDLRDPWMDGEVYGYGGLSAKRKRVEYAYEREVMCNADWILTPAQKMTDRLVKVYGAQTNPKKFQVLHHAFDRDEFGETGSVERLPGRVMIITGGTIDLLHIREVAEPFFQGIHQLKETDPELYKKVHVHFYGSSLKLQPVLKELDLPGVTFLKKTTPHVFFQNLRSADFLLVLLPEYVKDYFITKIGEYLALHIPLMLVSYKGVVSDFVKANGLGTFLDVESAGMQKELHNALKAVVKGQYTFNSGFDANVFSAEKAVEQLESYFV
ncbi:MAG TPA: hypothetical protein VD905_20420 [Flavobacteriales bacterium]|nr:hypothetical protein [Flavobacteriales bacterium]